MTVQALAFLCKARKVQMLEDGEICIVDKRKVMRTVHENGKQFVERKISKTSNELRPMLEYLEQKDLLEIQGDCFFSLTYDGFHYFQTIATGIIRFVLTSVAVPVVVAFFTTVISLWLTGVFKSPPAP